MKLLLSLLLTVMFCTSSIQAKADDKLDEWIAEFKKDAQSKGISKEVVDRALEGFKPSERIIELDRKQPEGTMTFAQYQNRVISDARIQQGRRMYEQHKDLLEKTAKKYGVPAQYIVALWGIETSYGNNTGGFNVPHALATLAYDGRRSSFFRGELINALKIIDAGHINNNEMKGSWAGAMGQNQFMPSSFHAYAVDGNDDGKRDIWTSLPDVFASTANYLSKSGWKGDQRWGRRVALPKDFRQDKVGLNIQKNLAQWRALGVTLPNGQPIPTHDTIMASLVMPDGEGGPVYLVYNNYRVIMKWNKSTYFATSVGLLADKIAQ